MRGRIPAARLLVAAAFLLLVPAVGAAPLRGIPIHAGDTASSEIRPSGDTDLYVFDAYAGSSLTVTLSARKKSGLMPTLGVLDPTGAPLSLAGHRKTKKSKVVLKKLPLTVTGRYAIAVGGENGTEGAYQLKTKAAWPKKSTEKGVALHPEETLDVDVPGVADTAVSVKIRDREAVGIEVVEILDPDGREIPGAVEAFTTKRSRTSGKFYLAGPVGDSVVRLGNAGASTTLDIVVNTKYPKVKRRKLEITPLEPVVSSLDPTAGLTGTTVDITGENFVAGDGLEVLFGETPSPVVSHESDLLVTATVPEGEGEVTITVYNPDGQSGRSPMAFTFIADPPQIASVLPVLGPDSGGTTVDVFGEGLGDVAAVVLGGTVVTSGPEIVDDDHLRFVTDAHAPGSAHLELIDTWGQSQTMYGAFTFYGPPEVAALVPARGSRLGDTEVTITGTWLHPDDLVTLDGVDAASVSVVGYHEMSITTPPHDPGLVDLVIEDPWGRSVLVADAFEYTLATTEETTDSAMPANTTSAIAGGRCVALGDTDRDGDLDMVVGRVSGPQAGAFTVHLLNDGKGEFSLGTMPRRSGNGDDWQANAMRLGDIDGDGDNDLVLTCDLKFTGNYRTYFVGKVPYVVHNECIASTRLFLNDGKGNFNLKSDAFPNPAAVGTDILQGNTLALGDVDGDSDVDIVVSCNRSVGESYCVTKVLASFVHRYFSVTYTHKKPATRVLLNTGGGKFKDGTAAALPGLAAGDLFTAESVALGDVDGDLDLDIVLTAETREIRDKSRPEYVSGSKTRVLLNDGKGVFTNATASFVPAVKDGDDRGAKALVLGDLDGDSLADDLVLTSEGKLESSGGSPLPSTRLFLGDAKGFTDATATWIPAIAGEEPRDTWCGVANAIADPEGDGSPDVFLAHTGVIEVLDPDTEGEGRQVSSLRWLANTGDTPLLDITEKAIPDPWVSGDFYLGHAVVLGDLDGDGDLDIVLTTELDAYLGEGGHPTRIFLTR